MATNRFGYSDDFVLKNGKVGINTTEPQEKLDVVGVVKGQDLKVTGVSSFTTYEGFLEANHTIDESITLTSGTNSSLSGEIIVGTGVTVTIANVGLGTTTVGVGTYTTSNTIDTDEIVSSGQGNIDSLKVYNTFTVPTGGTEDRPIKVKPGQLYYNKDFKTVEFWDGNNWRQVDYTTRSGRMVIASGYSTQDYSVMGKNIQYLTIPTLGNTENFGELEVVNSEMHGCGSETRGLFGSGYGNSPAVRNNIIEYVTIQSAGNAIDFGDLTIPRNGAGSVSSSTRGIWGSGYSGSNESRIDSVQISTKGDSLNFGDVSVARFTTSVVGDSTRGIWVSGCVFPALLADDFMDFITIQSGGTAVEFGSTDGFITAAACSSGTRGVFGGGYNPRPGSNGLTRLDYITISSTGNSSQFGDLTASRTYLASASTSTRGVFTGGANPSGSPYANDSIIDYITFTSLGNAQDFGDLSNIQKYAGATSDSHGGLGGF